MCKSLNSKTAQVLDVVVSACNPNAQKAGGKKIENPGQHGLQDKTLSSNKQTNKHSL
jgi:hypothetical protein